MKISIYRELTEPISNQTIDLADALPKLPSIEIIITGLRPGEKLYEELLIEDNSLPTKHPKIFKAQESFVPWNQLRVEIQFLKDFIFENNINGIISILTKLDIGYNPPLKIVDWFFNEKIRKSSKNIKNSTK